MASSPRAAMVGLACALAAAGCAGPSAPARTVPPPPPPAGRAEGPGLDSPAAVLSRFVGSLEGGRWQEASTLLSARWRAVYTPGRLAADYGGAGPLAREAAARVAGALAAGAPLAVEGGRAVLPVAGGRALLLWEEGGWRVDALE